MRLYYAKLEWRGSFHPSSALVCANNVEEAMKFIHKHYEKDIEFHGVSTLECIQPIVGALIYRDEFYRIIS